MPKKSETDFEYEFGYCDGWELRLTVMVVLVGEGGVIRAILWGREKGLSRVSGGF